MRCLIILKLWKVAFFLANNLYHRSHPEMMYCEISKEMLLLYFGLTVFCRLEARVPEYDTQPLPPNSSGLYSVHCNTEHCVKLWHSSYELAKRHQAQNTTTTSLCWSNNTSSLISALRPHIYAISHDFNSYLLTFFMGTLREIFALVHSLFQLIPCSGSLVFWEFERKVCFLYLFKTVNSLYWHIK
jgi:hypothetical protein